MVEITNIFTLAQGNFLIRLLLAHILADFPFQSRKMVENKTWFSGQMLLHIGIVFVCTLVLTVSFKVAIVVAILHYFIDAFKSTVGRSGKFKKHRLFVIDQALHLLVILAVWGRHFQLFGNLIEAFKIPFLDYRISLYILAYGFAIWPLGYLIRFALIKMMPQSNGGTIENAGRLIGQFERIIILTFVLLTQYEAIGFLITGKSIIRFADRNSELKSEYVLVGTMMSYGLCILTGIVVLWLLQLAKG